MGAVDPARLVAGEHERDLAAALRQMADDLLQPAQLRAGLDSPDGFPPDVWKVVAGEIGLCGLTVPEEFGGLGLGWAEVNTVHVELGRSLYPGPFLAGSIATTALLAAADRMAAERWLPAVADGSTVLTIALAVCAEDRAVASRDEHGWRVSGTFAAVVGAHVAQQILVCARTHAGGPTLFSVDRAAAEVTVAQVDGLDLTRRCAAVRLDEARAVLVGQPGNGAAVLDAVGRHLRLALAAEAVGGLEWCVETSVEHVKTRQQFGRPIGAFQAVAHACVETYAAAQQSRAAARWAACAADAGSPDALQAGHVAALRAGEAFRARTEATIHLLGGIGFTWEHDAHLYYRRARSAAALAGGAAVHRSAIAQLAGARGPFSVGTRLTRSLRRDSACTILRGTICGRRHRAAG